VCPLLVTFENSGKRERIPGIQNETKRARQMLLGLNLLWEAFLLFLFSCAVEAENSRPDEPSLISLTVNPSFESFRKSEGWHPFLEGYALSFSSFLEGIQGITLQPSDTIHESLVNHPRLHGLWQYLPQERIPKDHRFGITVSLWYYLLSEAVNFNNFSLRVDVGTKNSFNPLSVITYLLTLISRCGIRGSIFRIFFTSRVGKQRGQDWPP